MHCLYSTLFNYKRSDMFQASETNTRTQDSIQLYHHQYKTIEITTDIFIYTKIKRKPQMFPYILYIGEEEDMRSPMKDLTAEITVL